MNARKHLTILTSCVILTGFLAVGAAQAAEPSVVPQTNSKSVTPPPDIRRDKAADPKKAPANGKVDLNLGSAEEIASLPGVGPSTAQAIIKARPFKTVNELTNVGGIGPAKLAVLKPHVTVRTRAVSVGKPLPGQKGSEVVRSTESSPGKAPARSPTVRSSTERERDSSKLPSTKDAVALGQKVNLNTATLEQLESLPGIGPVKAQAIIDARPFNSPEDIMKVKGIKEGIFGEIKDQVTVK